MRSGHVPRSSSPYWLGKMRHEGWRQARAGEAAPRKAGRQSRCEAGAAKAFEAGPERGSNRGRDPARALGRSSHADQLAERLKTDQGNIARLERGRTQATIR